VRVCVCVPCRCAVLCCAVLCCAVLCCAVLCCRVCARTHTNVLRVHVALNHPADRPGVCDLNTTRPAVCAGRLPCQPRAPLGVLSPQEKWEEGYYITAMAGSMSSASLVVMSKGTPYTQQSYKVCVCVCARVCAARARVCRVCVRACVCVCRVRVCVCVCVCVCGIGGAWGQHEATA
jgi:hypothetical protein